jgi:hypothetical protein
MLNKLGSGAKAESRLRPGYQHSGRTADPTAAGIVGGLLLRLVADVSPEGWRHFVSSARINIPRVRSKEIDSRPWQKQQCLAGSTGEIMRAMNPEGRGKRR